jgi:plasmid stabilization system protein ParE
VTLFWTRCSRRDLAEIERFIGRDDPETATRWVARLEARARKAAAAPLTGRIVPELGRVDVREVILKTYRIVYLVRSSEVIVLTVFESHRRLPSVG